MIGISSHNIQHRTLSTKQKGTTLVEIIVVLAVFAIIIGAAIDIFISIVQHQKRILTEQEFLNQTSYVIEYMSRSIRMSIKDTAGTCLGTPGYLYLLTHYNASSGFFEGIKFTTNSGVCQEFFLDRSDGILKEIKNGVPVQGQSILSSKFLINHARFILNGNKMLQGVSKNDLFQPRITMLFNINTKIAGSQQQKIFQTTVSQRNLNVP